jgi:copper chaperone CopZ
MKGMLLGLLGAGAVGAFAVCDVCQPPATADAQNSVAMGPAVPAGRIAEVRKVTLEIDGMTCGGCAVSTRATLLRLPGVAKAEVSLAPGRAVVVFDPAKTSVEKMIAAIKQLGYTATVAE